MPSEKTYTIPKPFWLVPIAVSLYTLSLFWQPFHWAPVAFMAGLNIVAWGAFLTMPLEIRFLDDETILFRGILKQSRVPIAEIVAIEQASKSITIIHQDGKVWLSYLISNLDVFVTQLKRQNPAIDEDYSASARFLASPKNLVLLMVMTVVVALLIIGVIMISTG